MKQPPRAARALVFYNVVLKWYLLIDLKLGKLAHQDVGRGVDDEPCASVLPSAPCRAVFLSAAPCRPSATDFE
jgi:hypothetical protein